MGWVPSVRQNNSLEVLTGERTCLKIQVLIFCVIDRVCDTQTPPTWHSLQVKSNNGHYLPSLSGTGCLHGCASLSGVSHFPPVSQTTEQRWSLAETPLPVVSSPKRWVGSLDLTSVPLMYSIGSFDLTSDSLMFLDDFFDLTSDPVILERSGTN